MTVIFRIVISAIVIVATFYFLYWVPFAFIHIPWGIAAFLSYAGAMAAGWFAWTRTASVNPTLTRSIGYWALVVGAIGFIGGFFGPMIIVPGANQGPLLGILITGPLGVLIGAVGGLVHWLVQRKRSGTNAPT
jgi:hypothetical protein